MSRQHNIQTPGSAVQQAMTQQSGNEQRGDDDSNVQLVGLGDPDAAIDVEGRVVTLNEIVTSAFETSGLSVLEWNALEGVQRDGFVASKRSELATLYRNAPEDMPTQEEARANAQAAAARRQAARQANPGNPVGARESSLPHRDEIDPKAISAPVLTQQGWVVHSPKALPRNFQ